MELVVASVCHLPSKVSWLVVGGGNRCENAWLWMPAQAVFDSPGNEETSSGGDPTVPSIAASGNKLPRIPKQAPTPSKTGCFIPEARGAKNWWKNHVLFFPVYLFSLFLSVITLGKGNRIELSPWLRTSSGFCGLCLFLSGFDRSLLVGPILCLICIHSQPIGVQ